MGNLQGLRRLCLLDNGILPVPIYIRQNELSFLDGSWSIQRTPKMVLVKVSPPYHLGQVQVKTEILKNSYIFGISVLLRLSVLWVGYAKSIERF